MSEIDDVISTIQERLKTELVVDYSVLLSLLGPAVNADRAILWLIVEQHIEARSEWVGGEGRWLYSSAKIPPSDATGLVLFFLSRFPEEEGAKSVCMTEEMEEVEACVPSLASFISDAGAKTSLMTQLRTDRYFGFLEVQRTGENTSEWPSSCLQVLDKVADAIAARLKFEQENL